MSWDKERAFGLLRTRRQREQLRTLDAGLPRPSEREQPTDAERAQAVALAGVWRRSWFARFCRLIPIVVR